MTILVVGGGQAALSMAAKYRALGGEGDVIICGDEPAMAYQRPPLSKAYLAGDMERERLYLRPESWYEDQNITFRSGVSVSSIDRTAKTVTTSAGETLSYNKLVLATGSRARPLPEQMTDGISAIYTLRTLGDIDMMRDEFQHGRRLVVIGGGYIGLEAAAIARKLGVEASVVEAAPRILGRVASTETADFIRNMHLSHGVSFYEGVGVDSFEAGADGRVNAVLLSDGTHLDADFVIAGIGILPNSEVAEAAGLSCDGGIIVSQTCQTDDEDIFAAGDCTRFDYQGQLIRLESVGNAIDQGEVIAANLASGPTEYEAKPWFWSDQYDITLQIAGLNLGYDDIVVRPGTKDGTQSVWYYAGEKLLAVDAIGDARAYMIGKRLIESGKSLPKDKAADPHTNLKEFL